MAPKHSVRELLRTEIAAHHKGVFARVGYCVSPNRQSTISSKSIALQALLRPVQAMDTRARSLRMMLDIWFRSLQNLVTSGTLLFADVTNILNVGLILYLQALFDVHST